MTKRFQIVWIDDSPERARKWEGGALDGVLRNTPVSVDLEVIAIAENFVTELSQRSAIWVDNPPDLIMLDHNLSTVSARAFGMHGSALAHLLRIQLLETPIVCVSGQNLNSDDFGAEDISEYTYLFAVNDLDKVDKQEMLFALAEDFKLLQFPAKQSVRKPLLNTLKAPPIDQAALLSILPEEFEGEFIHGTSPHRMASWIVNVLMKRPGFLSDSLEAATLIGLTEDAFEKKIKERFDAARYQGPFTTESRPLWWSSAITDVLYKLLPEHSALPPQIVGRKFQGIEEADFSRCAATGNSLPAPDVVAYTDATKSARRAVYHSYTSALSDDASSALGFATYLKIRNPRRGD